MIDKDKFVIVYVWLPITKEGEIRNMLSALREALAAVGHVALRIVDKKKNYNEYVSLWPAGGGDKDNILPAFFPSFHQDKEAEGGHLIPARLREPDARIVLYSLNVDEIINRWEKLKLRKQQLQWTMQQSEENVKKDDKPQSCATFILKLLEAGGFKQKLSPARSGPNGKELRKKFKCDEGSFLGGIFDFIFWREWKISPKYILHLAASGHEKERESEQVGNDYERQIDMAQLEMDNIQPRYEVNVQLPVATSQPSIALSTPTPATSPDSSIFDSNLVRGGILFGAGLALWGLYKYTCGQSAPSDTNNQAYTPKPMGK